MQIRAMAKKDPSPADRRRGQRLRDRRKALGLDVTKLAAAVGVSQPAVSQWEAGLTAPNRQKLAKLAQVLRVPVSWLVSDNEPLPQAGAHSGGTQSLSSLAALPTDVPVYGVAVGGSNGDFRFNGQVVDYVRRPPGIANARNVYALWILGESMSPWNKDGDLIYVSPARPPTLGDHVVVQLQDTPDGDPGLAMVKLLLAKTPTQLKLAQYNPQKEFAIALAKVKSIHKVLSLKELLGT
jgi:phage repressor protein C with HTH and peptisase S24 domain